MDFTDVEGDRQSVSSQHRMEKAPRTFLLWWTVSHGLKHVEGQGITGSF